MTSRPIIAQIVAVRQRKLHRQQRDLHSLALDEVQLPGFVRESPVAMRYLRLLGPLAWDRFPERDLNAGRPMHPVPYAALAAACMIKIDQGLTTISGLRRYLVEHPALVWLCGFRLLRSRFHRWGFDADASLPSKRHLTRMLRTAPNQLFQFLLSSSVSLIKAELAAEGLRLGESISLDTKHILAWVKENNPKAYVTDGRYDKKRRLKGDPDCRLGCKRRSNQRSTSQETVATPDREAEPASRMAVGEFYWGYASGVVATKVPGRGEFVLAELTQTFDRSDVTYFFPLMAAVEARLGRKPRFGAFDAAFDAWYVYEYFHCEEDAEAFAAIPFSRKGGYKADGRQFSPDGLPLCAAGKPMPLKFTYTDRTVAIIEHERGKYVCPLLHPQPTGDACPVDHTNWAKGKGCTVAMPTSIGARLRYQLDRDSQRYKDLYKQRTATERINSQALELGIERPKLRNRQAVTNLNSLIYVVINLRALQRLRQRKSA